MKIQFLGTGTSQGVPVITCDCEVCTSIDPRDERLRSSLLISENGKNMVIDAGPDFRQQMLVSKVKKLDAVLLTHEHKDHIGGLDDVRAFNFAQKRPMDVYAEERVLEAIKTKEFSYAFAEKKYPGVPRFELHAIENEKFTVAGFEVLPIRGIHMHLPVFGFRIKNMAYITDMNKISEKEKEKLQNLDVLIINALRRKKHLSHFNLEEALDMINELNPQAAYLTHMSHYIGSYRNLLKELPEHIMPAYDRLSFEL
jgi:phosphoribosyl 1,2-cyclic phosphate phosphodiesterase